MTDHKLCYYCQQAVENFSKEHVISGFLGCNVQVRSYMCAPCNNHFGRDFEARFAQQVNWIRTLFAFKDAEGELPPPLTGITTDDGKKYDMYPGGIFTLANPEFVNNGNQTSATYRNWREAKKHLSNLLQKAVGEIRVTLVKGYPPRMNFNFGMGGDDLFRSFGKSVINLLAKYKPNLLGTAELALLRDYVNNSDASAGKWFAHDFLDKNLLPDAIGPLDNSLVISYSQEEGCIRSHFQLYGNYGFICELPMAADIGDSFSIILQHDPFTGKRDIRKGPCLNITSLVACQELWESSKRFEYGRQNTENILKLYYDITTQAKIEDIARSSLVDAWGEPDGRQLTVDDVEKLAQIAAERATNWALRVEERKTFNFSQGDDIPDEL